MLRAAGLTSREANRLKWRTDGYLPRGRKEGTTVQAFIDALKIRIAAAEAEVEQLLKAGETRAAEIKAAVTAELKALLAELEKAVASL
jgi:hypothetical protein